LTELNNTLQVIIKNFLAFEISFTIRKTILISFNHHENDFLILIWTLKEILQESLFKNFLHFSIFVIILTFHIISIFILILILLLLFNFLWIFFLLFSRWIIINSIYSLCCWTSSSSSLIRGEGVLSFSTSLLSLSLIYCSYISTLSPSLGSDFESSFKLTFTWTGLAAFPLFLSSLWVEAYP